MKQPVRIILWVLCAVMIISAPLVFSSPNLLSEVKWELMSDGEEDEGTEEEEFDDEEGFALLSNQTADSAGPDDDPSNIIAISERVVRDLLNEAAASAEKGSRMMSRWFISSARAEDDLIIEETAEAVSADESVNAETVTEGSADDEADTEGSSEDSADAAVNKDAEGFGEPVYELPIDFSVPPEPNPACYTENGYEDETIRVKVEDREENGVIWHLAFVQIASPTQLRTATAAPGKLTSTKTVHVSDMAKYNHAVVTLNGDNFVDKPDKTTFEYRMGQKIRNKGNRTKDVLIIDGNGDFHFVLADKSVSADRHTSETRKTAEELGMVNAFTFGPALVIDGQVASVNTEYGYNPNGREPRTAIGQTGKLSYVLVIAEGRGESAGVTQQELADFMGSLGCTQAFNLDGGNSAEMVFGETIYKGMPDGAERSLSDVIYFATAVPEENWK